ncbi:hypothetical protein ABZ372_19750 [Streptomyces sp. NPDC005921]
MAENTADDDLASRFGRDGYAVLPDALAPDEVAELRAETVRICRGERGHVEGAPAPVPGESDDEAVRRFLCVHYPHKLSALMLDTMCHPAFRSTSRSGPTTIPNTQEPSSTST